MKLGKRKKEAYNFVLAVAGVYQSEDVGANENDYH